MPEKNCTRTDEEGTDGIWRQTVEGEDCLPTVASTLPCVDGPDIAGQGTLAVVPEIGSRVELVLSFTEVARVNKVNLKDGAVRVDVQENACGEAAELKVIEDGFVIWPIKEDGTGAARLWMEKHPDGGFILVLEEGTLMLENKDKTDFKAGELFVSSAKLKAGDRVLLADGRELKFDPNSVSKHEFYPSLADELDVDGDFGVCDGNYDVNTAIASVIDDETVGDEYSIIGCELRSIKKEDNLGGDALTAGIIVVIAVTIAMGAGKQVTRIVEKILPSKKD